MNIKIYVAMHKPNDNVKKILSNPIYVPIHCGKAIYKPDPELKDTYLPELGDNTGDNISAKNPNYCELTAMYWAWKNDKTSDIIGLNHYRRYFADPGDKELLSAKYVEEWLRDWDIIWGGSSTEYDKPKLEHEESIYDMYKGVHHIRDFDIMLEGIKILYPEYYPRIMREVMETNSMNLCNTFVANRKIFDDYCGFLFSVMNYVENHIDLNDDEHQGYNARVFGFLAERIFRPWVMSKGYTAKQIGGIDWQTYSGYNWT